MSNLEIDEKPQSCHLCTKLFTNGASHRRHLRMKHGVDTTCLRRDEKRFYRCMHRACSELQFVSITEFRFHLDKEHHVEGILTPLELVFDTFDEVKAWKTEQERKDVAKFISSRGVRHTMKASKWHFECNRSGAHKSRSTGLRRIKSQGSCKTGQRCPASIVVVERDKKYHVVYHSVHYGHERLLCHVSLSASDRQHIAAQLAQGVAPGQILQDIRHSVSGNIDRGHLITLKDVRNIQRAFGLDRDPSAPSDPSAPNVTQTEEVQPMTTGDIVSSDVGIDSWIRQMGELGTDSPILTYDRGSNPDSTAANEDFMLVVMNPLQRRILQKFGHDRICIDSTYKPVDPLLSSGEHRRNFELTTLMVTDDYEEAFPVAFMCSSSVNTDRLVRFFNAVKSVVGTIHPKSFLTDDSALFHTAWAAVMGEVDRKLPYTQYVDRTSRCLTRPNDQTAAVEGLDADRRQACQRAFRLCHTRLREVERDHVLRETCNVTHEQSLNPATDDRSIASVRLSRCVDSLLSFTLDKQFDRLSKLQRGKLSTKMASMVRAHSTGLSLAQSSVPLGQNRWQISSEGRQFIVRESFTSHVCTSTCVLTCRQCHACLTNMSCTCDDYQILGQMCAHVHAARVSAHGGASNGAVGPQSGASEPQQRRDREKMVSEEASDEAGLYVNSLHVATPTAVSITSSLRSSIRQLTTEVSGLIDKSERFVELSESSLSSVQAHLKAIRGILLAQKKPVAKPVTTRLGRAVRPARRLDDDDDEMSNNNNKQRQQRGKTNANSGATPEQNIISLSNATMVEPLISELTDQTFLSSLLVSGSTEGISTSQLVMIVDDDNPSTTMPQWSDQNVVLSMMILKQQFPNVIGLHCSPAALCSEAVLLLEAGLVPVVQVHPSDERENHWVTSTRGPGETHVTVYDFSPVLDAQNQPIMSALLQSQISQMYRCTEREITVLYPELPQPLTPSSNGSLTSIIIATDLCCGLQPSQRRYELSLSGCHLQNCLERSWFDPFPAVDCGEMKKAPSGGATVLSVYCYCRGPVSESMVDCVRCLESFHCECVSYTGGVFICTQCSVG